MTTTYNYRLHSQSKINEDIIRLEFLPADPKKVLHYQAGQYIKAAKNPTRLVDSPLALSVATPDSDHHLLEFHIRCNEKQDQARHFIEDLKSQKEISIEGPFGEMTNQALTPNKPLILIAGGTGITPFKALLEEMLRQPSKVRVPSIHLLWGIRKPNDFYLFDFLESLKNSNLEFNFDILIDPENSSTDWHYQIGLPNDFLQHKISTPQQYQYYLSGPFEMIKKCYDSLRQRDVQPSNIMTDML